MPRRHPPTPQTPFYAGEVHDIPFRFGREMRADETIVSVAVDCVSAGAVVDVDPLQRVTTPPQVLDTSTVVQRFATAAAGTRYLLTVQATLSSGRVFIGAGLIFVIEPKAP